MARDWRSKHAVDHRDLQATTFSIDSTGKYAVLAGRRHLGIIPLDNPSTTLIKTNRDSKWEFSKTQWSPHHKEMFVGACNQTSELFNWTENAIKPYKDLKAHRRAISDLDWSVYDANLLATASIDTYTFLWDIRDARRPSISLVSPTASVFQVKWNRILQHMIATSHEGDIRIWDTRKTSNPIEYMTAHLSKIHNIDWCPTQENMLVTASQDGTVKFWDVTNLPKKDAMLPLKCPVWRAQYTPFGNGLLTVVVPPLSRGDNSLLLWNTRNLSNPEYIFYGHSDTIVDFGFRKPSEDAREYELVAYSKDYQLRSWIIDVPLQKACGLIDIEMEDLEQEQNYGIRDGNAVESLNRLSDESPLSSTAAPSKRRSKSLKLPSLNDFPQNLEQEFSLVNLSIPNIIINEMDASKRLCIVTVKSGPFVVCLKIAFPTTYPFNCSPNFSYGDETNVDDAIKEKLFDVVKTISHQQVRRNMSCLEPCLRLLASAVDKIAVDAHEQQRAADPTFHYKGSQQPSLVSTSMYGFPDVSVPFPRTSGARFCGADRLVVFTRPPHLQRINAPTDLTPRSLSALAGYIASQVLPVKAGTRNSSQIQLGQFNLIAPSRFNIITSDEFGMLNNAVSNSPNCESSPVSISSFYHHERKHRIRRSNSERKSSGPKTQTNCGAVLIFNIAELMPINQVLAQNYVLYSHDISGACLKNATTAAAAGCNDLVQIWTLASLIISPIQSVHSDADGDVPWAYHPFGRKLLHSLIMYYVKKHDVQTASMLACIFHNKSSLPVSKKVTDISNTGSGSPGGSPYHTVGVPADNTSESWILVGAAFKRNRSNSWSDSVEEYRYFQNNLDYRDSNREANEAHSKLLDPELSVQYDRLKKVYSDILYRWNLLEQRAQVLKYVSTSRKPEKLKGIYFVTECQHCHKDSIGAQCQYCRKGSLMCIICRVVVKGPASFCLFCGHGGHTSHMEEWFSDMNVCPSGCGCMCLEEYKNS